jgi:orotate phosphoribosyltransferase-like protein
MYKMKVDNFYSLVVNFWLTSTIKIDGKNLACRNFIEKKEERERVAEYLENISDFSKLREMIYKGGLIDNKRYLDDETGGQDKLAFFTLSYLTTIFWLLEDCPNPLETGIGTQILKQIKMIPEGLRNQNSEIIVKSFEEVLKLIRELNRQEKPKICGFEDDTNIFLNLTKKGTFKEKFIIDELKKTELFIEPFNIFKLFNISNELVDPLIYNIYDFLKQNEYSDIIGVERSGVPLASVIAYRFNRSLHILRTVPALKLLPYDISMKKAAILDDIAVTGTNLKIAKKYLNEIGVRSLKTIVISKDDTVNNIDKFLFERKSSGNNLTPKHKFKILEPENIQSSLKYELKTLLKKYCTSNGYWYSEYAYCKGIFRPVCDEFVRRIEDKQIEEKYLIVSTSIFGLPFASVVSYILKRPLYLFSRRPNLILDFNQKISLKDYLEKGFTRIVFVDDVFSSGTTEEVAEQRLMQISKNIKIDKFVLAYLGENNRKPDNLEYIVNKSDLK